MAMSPLPFQALGIFSATTQQNTLVPGAMSTGTTPNTTNPGAAANQGNTGSRPPAARAGSPFGMMDRTLMR